MSRYFLSIQLRSDATFGRGAGVAGLVDVEIEHDQYGRPFIGGRALKGLLVEEWANLRFVLDGDHWDAAATWLFGVSGGSPAPSPTEAASLTTDSHAHLHIGAATLPPDLHDHIRRDVDGKRLQPQEVLSALTAIRRQTAIDPESGAPERGSLRSMRVLLRETTLIAPLDFDAPFPEQQQEAILGVLSACVLAVRRGGTGRNRGRGRLALRLHQGLPTSGVALNATAFTLECLAALHLEGR